MSQRVVVSNATIATVDPADTEITNGHVVTEGGRIVAVGTGLPPSFADQTPTRRVDSTRYLAMTGLVNTHQQC